MSPVQGAAPARQHVQVPSAVPKGVGEAGSSEDAPTAVTTATEPEAAESCAELFCGGIRERTGKAKVREKCGKSRCAFSPTRRCQQPVASASAEKRIRFMQEPEKTMAIPDARKATSQPKESPAVAASAAVTASAARGRFKEFVHHFTTL